LIWKVFDLFHLEEPVSSNFHRVAVSVIEVIARFWEPLPLHFVQGYDTQLGQRGGGNLSGGQKQRIAIARVLLLQPAILILDDSTSSVEVETESKIQDALESTLQERSGTSAPQSTSFVIAHRLSTIRDADQVLVINEGQIIERGTHQSLLAQKGFYQHLYVS